MRFERSATIGGVTVPDPAEPRVLARAEHPISRSLIDKNALKVLYRLHGAGYQAYLVGGSVRDLMLGRRPKDFDVATDARPADIRRVFRNARIIGRRFRLAHVIFQGAVVEVSTFRRDPPREGAEDPGELLITSDNTFGTPREDAFRRDFTVNALFYNIADFSVVDYVGGIEDLERRVVRAIGDPDVRFQEDPVRMVRACEFAARLQFTIDQRTQEAIHRQRKEMAKAAPARLTEELVQLLRCGHAGAALQWMLDLGLLEVLLPEAYAMVAAGEKGLGEFGNILPVIDRMRQDGRELSDTSLLAALLLPQVLLRRYDVEALAQRPMSRQALQVMAAEAIAPFFARLRLSNLKAQQVLQAILGFNRLCEPKWTPVERVRYADRPYFDDALFLFEVLVEATGDGHEALGEWRAARARRPQRGAVGAPASPPRRRRRRRPGTRRGAGHRAGG
jgi:poly(A) polymerase